MVIVIGQSSGGATSIQSHIAAASLSEISSQALVYDHSDVRRDAWRPKFRQRCDMAKSGPKLDTITVSRGIDIVNPR